MVYLKQIIPGMTLKGLKKKKKRMTLMKIQVDGEI